MLLQLQRSEAALRVLESETDARGRKIEVVQLPVPPPMYYKEEDVLGDATNTYARQAGERLAASYVNFYLCNGGLICAAFGGVAQQADER